MDPLENDFAYARKQINLAIACLDEANRVIHNHNGDPVAMKAFRMIVSCVDKLDVAATLLMDLEGVEC